MITAVDLSMFQFDRDLTMATFFMNADGTIYGRYGTRTIATRSPEAWCPLEPATTGADSDDTLRGFELAAEAALKIHDEYKSRAAEMSRELAAKTGSPLRWKDLQTMLQGHYAEARLTESSCIHCHCFATGTWEALRREQQPIPDSLIWSYPVPDILGFPLDPRERATVRAVIPGSEAEAAGLAAGDQIVRMGGQPVISVADVQWVLHTAPDAGEITLEIDRGGRLEKQVLLLPDGWRRRSPIAWRTSMFSVEFGVLGAYVEVASHQEREKLGIPEKGLALKVTRLWGKDPYSKKDRKKGSPRSDEKKLQVGDVIVEVDGISEPMSRGDLIAYLLRKKPSDNLIRLKVKRNDGSLEIERALKNLEIGLTRSNKTSDIGLQ